MCDEALCVSQIVADANELERVLKPESAGLSAFHLECDQRGPALHLSAHDIRLWVVWAAGIH
jgi:hypothetical protein